LEAIEDDHQPVYTLVLLTTVSNMQLLSPIKINNIVNYVLTISNVSNLMNCNKRFKNGCLFLEYIYLIVTGNIFENEVVSK
jgi:hypothetical protein